MIDSSHKKMIRRFTPLLAYLKTKGIPVRKIVTTKTVKQMIQKFNKGDVQFMFDSALNTILIMDATGAVPILVREKGGVKQYNSVIFVKKDSPIKTLQDLKGKVIGFEELGSTSSFILPRRILLKEGLELIESRKPIAGKVAYYFTKQDKNTIVQVKKGKRADAGGIKTEIVKDDPSLRLLHPQSVYVPRHIVLVAKGLNYNKFKMILLNMKNDPEAKSVLNTAKTSTGFSEFDREPNFVMDELKKALEN